MPQNKITQGILILCLCISCNKEPSPDSWVKGNCFSNPAQDNLAEDFIAKLKPFITSSEVSESQINPVVIKTINLSQEDILTKRLNTMHQKMRQKIGVYAGGDDEIFDGFQLNIGPSIYKNPVFLPIDSSISFAPIFKGIDGVFQIDPDTPLKIRQNQRISDQAVLSKNSDLKGALKASFENVRRLSRAQTATEELYRNAGILFWQLVHSQPLKENSEGAFFQILEDALEKSVNPVLNLFSSTYGISLEEMAMTMNSKAFSENFLKLAGQRIPKKDLATIGL